MEHKGVLRRRLLPGFLPLSLKSIYNHFSKDISSYCSFVPFFFFQQTERVENVFPVMRTLLHVVFNNC